MKADHLHITWAERGEFLEAYDGEGSGSYTIASPRPGSLPDEVKVGDQLLVSLEFLDADIVIRHRAVVAAVDGDDMTLDFDERDVEVRDLIVCFANGESVPYLHRRVPRVATWLQTVMKIGGEWKSVIVTELAELGAFTCLVDPPAAPAEVCLRLASEDDTTIDLRARVVYVGTSPDDTPGCGLEFIFDGRADEDEKRAFLREALQNIQK